MLDPKIVITPQIHKLTSEIDEFKGKWEALQQLSPERLNSLRKTATIESIASSTRIEGATLSNVQVEALLDHVKSYSFKSRDEQEVVGYAEAMDLVFQAFNDMEITENHIKQLHSLLLKYSEKDQHHKGKYKTLSNNVAAFDGQGNQLGIIFETATPFDTPSKMEELVRWTLKSLGEESLHDLLIIGVFVVVFLAIHPFQDGNGRLSRILTTLLLLRRGYTYVPYSSMESVIEDNKDLYYKALRRTQSTLNTDDQNWDTWLVFFLRSMKKQKDNLLKRVEKEKLVSQEMSPLALDILNLFDSESYFSIQEIVEKTNANRNTVKVRLRELVSTGLLLQEGKGRAVRYRKQKDSKGGYT